MMKKLAQGGGVQKNWGKPTSENFEEPKIYTQSQVDTMVVNALEDYIAKKRGILWVAVPKYFMVIFLCAVAGCTLNFFPR